VREPSTHALVALLIGWCERTEYSDTPVPAYAFAGPDVSPVPAVGRIRDRVAFYNELVDIAVDGTAQERPVSVFSIRANRPVSSSPRVDPFGGTGR
jgi:hypothetical protein